MTRLRKGRRLEVVRSVTCDSTDEVVRRTG
jgi:hypothetical protein